MNIRKVGISRAHLQLSNQAPTGKRRSLKINRVTYRVESDKTKTGNEEKASLKIVAIISATLLFLFFLVKLFLSPAAYVEIEWVHYHDYTETVTILLTLNETHSSVVDVFSIGKSLHGRDIYCVRLTNESNQTPKPEVFFIGYHHGCEQISSELPLYFVVYATINFNSNQNVTDLLNRSEIYVVVALNVDRLKSFENEHQRNNYKYRYNARGVDLNRNYDYQWSPQERRSGSAPFSEPETQAIRDFVLKHNFVYAVSFHSGIKLILYPWSHTKAPTPGKTKFVEISRGLSRVTGRTPYEQASDLYIAYGTWSGWMYGVAGVFALTCELYGEPGGPTNGLSETRYLMYNPPPSMIKAVTRRWLPVFFYTTNIAIAEAWDARS